MLPLPAFTDNYIWMLHDSREAVVVDPGDAAPVLQALHDKGLSLRGILVTHHHGDHVGGVNTLRAATGAAVYGPAGETMPQPLTRLRQGDNITVLGLRFVVLDVPGHTAGHIAYYCAEMDGAPLLGPVAKLSATPAAVRSTPPRLGQHSEDILHELGYAADAIELLRTQRII